MRRRRFLGIFSLDRLRGGRKWMGLFLLSFVYIYMLFLMSFNFKELEQESYRNGSLLPSMTIDFGVHCSVDSPVYNHQVACAFQFQQSNSQTHQRRKIQQESHLPQGFQFSTCNSLLSSWKRSFLRDGLSDWKGIPVRGSCDGRGLQ